PGVLSTYPGAIPEPDPDLLAAHAPARGLMLLGSAGDIALLNETTFEVELGARLTDPPDPADGLFVPGPDGRLWRVAAADGLVARIYDPARDFWAAATIEGDDSTARPGAAWAAAPDRRHVYLAGGGDQRDVLALALPSDDGAIQPEIVGELDGPRTGARLLALDRGDTDSLVLVGGADEAAPAVLLPGSGHTFGPVGAWTNIQCIVTDPAEAAEDSIRVLCLGGLRGGQPTADGLLLRCPPAAADTVVEELPALLTAPAADPRLFADDLAVYAQSDRQWWRIGKDDLGVTVAPSPASRVSGGHSIMLGTGVTFLVGGTDPGDRAVDSWWFFAPTLPSP
ncbi:MAG TPA: hypothetical protein VIK91_14130, partial [Nannocystis sp.]